MDLAPMFAELVSLEQQVSSAAKAANAADELRVWPWRPTANPDLPAIWNWIDDGSVADPDTARIDDIIIVSVTIGVKPTGRLEEKLDQLVRITDVFREVVDPALKRNQPLNNTAKQARRLVTRTAYDDFNGIEAMCMEMLIRVQLPRLISG